MILAAKASLSYWPLAFRQAVEQRHRAQMQHLGVLLPDLLPFGATAVVRKKEWHHRADPFRWPMMKVRLWGPAGDMAASSQGYFVQSEDGKFLRSTVVIVPSQTALQGDLQQSLVDDDARHDLHQQQEGNQQEGPGSLPGGEERQGQGKQAGEVLFDLEDQNGEGQVVHELEDLNVLKELAKKAESGVEGLAEVFIVVDVCKKSQQERYWRLYLMIPLDDVFLERVLQQWWMDNRWCSRSIPNQEGRRLTTGAVTHVQWPTYLEWEQRNGNKSC